MATVKSSAAGSFRGRIGNKIYRKFNGKTVVGKAPEFVNVSNSRGCLNSRFRFKITEDLAKTVKTFDLLYGLWFKVKPVGANKFSRIMKANLSYTTPKGPGKRNVITPLPESVPFRFRENCAWLSSKNTIGIKSGRVFADIKVCRNNPSLLTPPYTAYFIIFLRKQNTETDFPEYEFIYYDVNVLEETKDELQHIEVPLSSESITSVSKYSYATVLFALVKVNDETNKYEWSQTECAEVILDQNPEC